MNTLHGQRHDSVATAATLLWNIYSHRPTNGVVIDEEAKPPYVHVDSGQDVEDLSNALEIDLENVLQWHAETLAKKGTFERSDFEALVALNSQ